MHCPYCSHTESRVTDSRDAESAIRRRRECLKCQRRYTTYERVHSASLMVAKRDGRRESFSRDKMIAGLQTACAKRPVAPRDIERMVDDIENEFQQNGSGEVRSELLGTAVMERLQHLDRVAYIRFASVHRNFQEIESFETAVQDLRDGTQQLALLDMPPQQTKARGRRRAARPSVLTRNNVADNSGQPEGVSIPESHSTKESEKESEIEEVGDAAGKSGGDEE